MVNQQWSGPGYGTIWMHTRHSPLLLAVSGVHRRPPLTFHVLGLRKQMYSINSSPEILRVSTSFRYTGFLSVQDVGDLHFSLYDFHKANTD